MNAQHTAPTWTAADEAMRWLNEIEAMQGGANGPTIKLRAALLLMTETSGRVELTKEQRQSLCCAGVTSIDP